MSDKEFLLWLHERINKVYGETELYDYMQRLKSIANKIESYKDDTTRLNFLEEQKISLISYPDGFSYIFVSKDNKLRDIIDSAIKSTSYE